MSSGSGETAARDDLDRRIVRSSGWVALSYGGRSLLSMAAMLGLVRLVEPRAFGLMALASTLLLVLEYVQHSGVAAAVVYRRGDEDDREAAASSAFAFAAVGGVLLAAAAAAAAPLLSWATREPVTDVVRALSLLLVLRGLAVAHGALIERELDFRTRAFAELSAGVAQVAVSLGLAAGGLGVWSLVAGQLAASAVQTGLLWILVPWRPQLRRVSLGMLRNLMRYGRYVSAGNVLALANSTLDTAAIGRLLGASSLGVYSVAYRLADFPTAVIGYVVGRVMFPAYAHLQDDLAAFRRAFVQNLQRVALLSLPVSVFLIVAARPVVLALLGERWLAAVGPLRILAVFGLVRAFASPCGAVFQAAGRPGLVPLWALPHALLIIPALVLLVPLAGLEGAAWAIVVSFSASGVPAFVAAMRLLELRPAELWRSLSRAFACSAVLAAALAALLPAAEALNPFAGLALLAAAGTAVYAATAAALARETIVPIAAALRSRT